ncbi:MAG: hypothetical protein IT353_18115 [Gemmatimonadaceae bacterium]|nr:hypothetical protein [Gemmatimonadaceae bacterium]
MDEDSMSSLRGVHAEIVQLRGLLRHGVKARVSVFKIAIGVWLGLIFFAVTVWIASMAIVILGVSLMDAAQKALAPKTGATSVTAPRPSLDRSPGVPAAATPGNFNVEIQATTANGGFAVVVLADARPLPPQSFIVATARALRLQDDSSRNAARVEFYVKGQDRSKGPYAIWTELDPFTVQIQSSVLSK